MFERPSWISIFVGVAHFELYDGFQQQAASDSFLSVAFLSAQGCAKLCIAIHSSMLAQPDRVYYLATDLDAFSTVFRMSLGERAFIQ